LRQEVAFTEQLRQPGHKKSRRGLVRSAKLD